MKEGATHLQQNADGGRHAHHSDPHHRHLAPAAHRLRLHHTAEEFLSGHLRSTEDAVIQNQNQT